MKILFYGMHFSPEPIGIGKYSGELVDYLISQGHSVTAVVPPPYYPDWKIHKPNRNAYSQTISGKLRVMRCPVYIPKKPTPVGRVLHLLSFTLSSLPVTFYCAIFGKTDVAVCIEPTKLVTPSLLIICKIFRIKSWLHIQDFELDAFQASTTFSLPAFLYKFESFLYRQFDHVSTISRSMIMKLVQEKGADEEKTSLFVNWVDTKLLSPTERDYFLNIWGYSSEDFIVMYSGNLGTKQGLELMIESARHVEATHPDIKFVIIGDGAAKSELLNAAIHLTNLKFFPLQPYELLPRLISFGNVHLVLQRKDFSDIVMPSKLTSLLSCGAQVIVTADKASELGRLFQEYPGIYRLIEPENGYLLTNAIIECYEQRPLLTNETAIEYSKDNLDKEKVLAGFEAKVKELIEVHD